MPSKQGKANRGKRIGRTSKGRDSFELRVYHFLAKPLKAVVFDSMVVVGKGLSPWPHEFADLLLQGLKIENAVGGPDGGIRAFFYPFGAGDRGNFGADAEFFECGLGEIVPGCIAGIGCVPEAGCAGVQQIENRLSEVNRVGRSAHLIVDDGQRFAGLGSLDHRSREVRAIPAIDPRGADDEPAGGGIFLEFLFAEEF